MTDGVDAEDVKFSVSAPFFYFCQCAIMRNNAQIEYVKNVQKTGRLSIENAD